MLSSQSIASGTIGYLEYSVHSLALEECRVEAYRRFLSMAEVRRAGEFRTLRDSNRFVVARGILRERLAIELNADPCDLEWDYSPTRKPFVKLRGNRTKLEFNVSHSGDYWLLALAYAVPVGADIEAVRPVSSSLRIIERFFDPIEVERVRTTDTAESDRLFFRTWTQNEAISKAIGIGLVFGRNRTWKVRADLDDYETDADSVRLRVVSLPTNEAYCASFAYGLQPNEADVT